MESTLEAIVEGDNDELLESFSSDFTEEDVGKFSESNSMSIMKYSIDKSAFKCVRVFLGMGIKVTESEASLMRKAIEKNDINFLEYLIEFNPSVMRETREADGKSALHVASEFGNVEMVKLLLGSVMVGAGKVDHTECVSLLIKPQGARDVKNNYQIWPKEKDRKTLFRPFFELKIC